MYSRLVATLDPCAPDLAPELMQQLKGEFRFRVSLLNTWLYLSMRLQKMSTCIPCACTCMSESTVLALMSCDINSLT